MTDRTPLDGCPWHPDTQPVYKTYLVGHRDDPDRLATLYCPACGVSRPVSVTNAESMQAIKNAVNAGHAGYSDTYLAVLVYERMAAAWNRPKEPE